MLQFFITCNRFTSLKAGKKCYLSPQYRQHNNEINKTFRNIAFPRMWGINGGVV